MVLMVLNVDSNQVVFHEMYLWFLHLTYSLMVLAICLVRCFQLTLWNLPVIQMKFLLVVLLMSDSGDLERCFYLCYLCFDLSFSFVTDRLLYGFDYLCGCHLVDISVVLGGLSFLGYVIICSCCFTLCLYKVYAKCS